MIRDIQYAKRHKDLQELHEYKEKMRQDQETHSKINELRRLEGYLAHLQPGARISYIQNRPDMKARRDALLASIGLKETPM